MSEIDCLEQLTSGLPIIRSLAESGFNFPRADFCGSVIGDELPIETEQ